MLNLANLINTTYIIYKRNGSGGVNRGKLYVNLITESTITLKTVIIIVNILNGNKNGFTLF